MKQSTERILDQNHLRPRSLERHVGARIRHRRILLGLNQQQLAEMVGVTFQQMHKYEKGLSRFSAGRLYYISRALYVDIDYFFGDLREDQEFDRVRRRRMLLDLTRNFIALTNQAHRTALSNLVRDLADTAEHDPDSLGDRAGPEAPTS